MKAGWTTEELNNNVRFIDYRGNTPPKRPEGVRLITAKNVKMGVVNQNPEEFVDPEAYDGWMTRGFPQKGDVLFTTEAPLGNVAQLNTSEKVIIGQRLITMQPDPELIDNAFLAYSLMSPQMQTQIQARGTGATVLGIKAKLLKAIPLSYPPLAEQKRIVSILDEAFEGLDRARENAEANLKSARELFESVLHASFSEDVDWDIAELNKHVQFVDYRGKTPPKMQSGIRLITAKNVKRGFINREPEEFMDQDAYDDWMTRGYPEIGDVLFTTEAPLANVALLDTAEKVVIGQRLITMKPDKGIIDSSFLCYALLSPKMQETIIAQGTGATVLGIKAKLLKAIPLRFPKDIRHQRDIAASCLKAFQNKGRLEVTYNAKLQDISDLRQSLLQKAFAGELT